MFTGIKIAAINSVKTAGGAVVFGVGFTLGAVAVKATLQALSNAANRMADKNGKTTRVTKAAETVATAA